MFALLQERLHNECSSLHENASECSQDLQERRAPLWVRATVGLFRTYFWNNKKLLLVYTRRGYPIVQY